MRITLEEVREVALLARLALDEAEAVRLRDELEAILGAVETVRAVDVEGAPPTTHAVPMDCPLREDVPGLELTQEEALQNAPRREETYFAVPRIVVEAGAEAASGGGGARMTEEPL